MEKKISSAVLFTDRQNFLVVHPTGEMSKQTYWDLPKGEIDEGESAIDAAVREFDEETGIKLIKSNLHHIGKYPLHKDKDIILYLYLVDSLPSVSTMSCKSTTKRVLKTISVPEIDYYRYFKLSEYQKIRTALHPVMKDVIMKIKEYVE